MKCDSVVLAAGYSSRAGTNKMALAIGNKTVLERVIDTLYPLCEKIVVVGGHHFNSTKQITDKYEKVILVNNEKYKSGMFSSVKRGVAEMTSDFFMVPGDYPAVRQSTYEKLAKGCGDMIIPQYKGRKGHPVFIKKSLIASLIEEPAESNLKVFRDRIKAEYIEVDDEGILLDIDTTEDYENIKKAIEGRGNKIED